MLIYAMTSSVNAITITKIDDTQKIPIPGDMKNNVFPRKEIEHTQIENQINIKNLNDRDDTIAGLIQQVN
jgi:hypothetical protein